MRHRTIDERLRAIKEGLSLEEGLNSYKEGNPVEFDFENEDKKVTVQGKKGNADVYFGNFRKKLKADYAFITVINDRGLWIVYYFGFFNEKKGSPIRVVKGDNLTTSKALEKIKNLTLSDYYSEMYKRFESVYKSI